MAGWWFVQDLRTINKIVVPCFPIVQIPSILLSQVSPDLKEVNAVDLSSALVSIPVDPMANIYYPMANRWLISIHFDLEQSTRYLDSHTSRLHWGLFLFLPSAPLRCVHAQLLSQVWLFVTPWILQARRVEWVASSYSKGSSRPRRWSRVSCNSCFGRWTVPLHLLGNPPPGFKALQSQGINLLQ